MKLSNVLLLILILETIILFLIVTIDIFVDKETVYQNCYDELNNEMIGLRCKSLQLVEPFFAIRIILISLGLFFLFLIPAIGIFLDILEERKWNTN